MGKNGRSVLMHEITWPEYADRIGESIVILPVASTEQHGFHLPLGTDTFQVNHAATRVAAGVSIFRRSRRATIARADV